MSSSCRSCRNHQHISHHKEHQKHRKQYRSISLFLFFSNCSRPPAAGHGKRESAIGLADRLFATSAGRPADWIVQLRPGAAAPMPTPLPKKNICCRWPQASDLSSSFFKYEWIAYDDRLKFTYRFAYQSTPSSSKCLDESRWNFV